MKQGQASHSLIGSTKVEPKARAVNPEAGAVSDGGLVQCNVRTITLSGTPAFSTAFALASRSGIIQSISNTFSGSATGPRYNVQSTAIIDVNGAGTTALPGNAAGTGTNPGASPYGLYQ